MGAKRIPGARKQELGSPILCGAAIAAAAAPRRPSSSSFAFDEDDLGDDDAPPPRSPSDYALLLSEAEQRGDWVKAVELVAEARVLRVKLPAAGYEAAARAAAAADQGDWQKAASFLARAARGGGGAGGAASSGDGVVADGICSPPPACSAIREVFSRLAREVQAEAIMELLDLLRGGGDEDEVGKSGASSSSSSSSLSSSTWSQRPAETRSHALNCAARACARASSGGKKMMRATDSSTSGAQGEGRGQEEQLSEEDRRIFFEASLSLLDDMREGDLVIEDGTFGSVALAALSMGEPELSEELLEERDYL